jgi:hypothetical protein
MKRGKRGLIFVLIFSLLITISYSSAIVLHQATDFKINVDGNSMGLQEAVDSGYMGGTASSYVSSSLISMGEHSAGQIWVNVDGAESSILNALVSANGLCASEAYSTYESSNIPNPGHVATEIGLSSGKTLQQAINEGDFCECTPETQKSCPRLNTECTRYVDYVTCNDKGVCNVTCSDEGLWPSCTIESYVARGTSCNSDGWHSCNGTGGCEGWSGTGCYCPFGYRDTGICSSGQNYVCRIKTGFQGRGDINTGAGLTWSSWLTSDNEVTCHRCTFCVFGWCWTDEDVAWQIKPK